MKLLLQLEMLALFFLAVWLFAQLELPWWWFMALILVPDVGMVGYLVNNQLGAFTYNLTHHLGVATVLVMAGAQFGWLYVELAGIIMLGHSALDRTFGYGLKYPDSFKHTHLG